MSDDDTSPAQTASGSSFYAAMRILPREQREAMFYIYSFCRQVDDIADSDGPRGERLEALAQWRRDIAALYSGNPPPRVAPYQSAVKRFGLKREDFIAIIDGMEMDVPAEIRAPDEATLDLYCDRVASAVGRLSVRVFGLSEEDGIALSHHLGRALQLTNILRDIDEDAGLGRLYLPREYQFAAGFKSLEPKMVVSDPRVDGVCRAVAAMAHEHYVKAAAILAKKPKGRIATPRLMGAVYGEILKATEAAGFAPPRHRVSLSRGKLFSLLLRMGLG